MGSDRIQEIEEKIAQLKQRWPAHSAPARMWQELEELESELEEARAADASAGSPGGSVDDPGVAHSGAADPSPAHPGEADAR